MSITPLPEAPSPLDPPDVFNAKAYSFFAALGVFGQEASDLAAGIDFTAADIQAQTATAAVAGGSSDAITASYAPPIAALTNGMLLRVRASAANTTSTPRFTPNAEVITDRVIVKNGGAALAAGDIAGAGHWLELQYDATLDKWVLQNPYLQVIFASAAENAAGTAEGKAVDPLGIREAFNATGGAPVYACRAWVNFNGTGTVAIRASGNVSSITDNGTGDYTVNFATALPDANFSVSGFSISGASDDQSAVCAWETDSQTTAAVRVRVITHADSSIDSSRVCVQVFR